MKKYYALLFFFSLNAICQSRSIDNSFSPSDNGAYQQNIGKHGVLLANGRILTSHSENFNVLSKVIALNPNGSIDNTFNCPGSSGSESTIYAKNDGNFLTRTGFSDTSGNNFVFKSFNSDGSEVTSFISPQFSGSSPGNPVQINRVIYQNDGKIIIVGRFNLVNTIPSKNIVRLNNNGTIDTTFNIGSSFSDSRGNNVVNSIVQQSDGKYIVCGSFTSYRGTARYCIARINIDGSVDTTFNVVHTLDSISQITNGFDNQIEDVKIQSNGKIIVVGSDYRTNYNVVSNKVVRLNSDGTRDTSFIHLNLFSISFRYCQIQSDGKILLMDYPYTSKVIKRIDSNGGNDSTFTYNNNTSLSHGGNEAIYLQGTKLLIMGNYHGNNGLSRYGIHRVNIDGSLDLTFNPQSGPNTSYLKQFLNPGFSGFYLKAKVLLDEKILFTGSFTSFNDTTCRNICRLTQNGELDPTFQLDNSVSIKPTLNSNNRIILQQYDGKILLKLSGGSDPWISANSSYKELIRLNSNGSLDNTFNFNYTGSDITDLKLLHDGKILAIGKSTVFRDSNNKYKILKINTNGTIDTGFTSILFNQEPASIDIQTDNKIIISFNYSNSSFTYRPVYRLNADGTQDTSFDINLNNEKRINYVKSLSNNKLLITYSTPSVNSRVHLGRLNSDGSIDTTFNIFQTKEISTPKLLLNDNIIIPAKELNATLAKMYFLNPDGVLLNSFATQDVSISGFDVQNCNEIIIYGLFNKFDNLLKNNIIRYGIPAAPAVQTPVGEIYQSFMPGQTLNNLSVTGTNLKWYDTPSTCALNNNTTTRNALEITSLLPSSTPLVAGTTYYASQTVNNIESDYRLPVTVYTSALSVNDFVFNSLKTYPNPVQDILTIKNDYTIDKIEIYNQIGQNILSKKIDANEIQLNFSNYNKGIYFARIYSQSSTTTTKLIKQ